jgi:hypothetical protein
MDKALPSGGRDCGFESRLGLFLVQKDNVAEWLRRQPAKLMGFARVGSNPTVVAFFFFFFFFGYVIPSSELAQRFSALGS